MDFIDLNAQSPEGQAKLHEFKMVAHGYAVLNRWGCIWWRSAGHSFTPEMLEGKIQEALAAPPDPCSQ